MEDVFIKAAFVGAIALAGISSFLLTAQQLPAPTPQQQQQQQSAPPQQTTPTAVPDNQPAQTGTAEQANPQANSQTAMQLQPVKGDLEGKLDSKTAKQGDSVVVKIKESVKSPDGIEIPKGSKLVGHLTNVQARGDGKENSQIAIQFDHAELKGGQSVAIQSVIQSIAPAESDTAMNSNNSGDFSGTGAAPSGSSGATMGTPSGATNNSNMNGHTNGPPMNSTAEGSMQEPNQAQAGNPSGTPAPGSIVARNGNVAIRMTAIPGVLLANNVNGQPFANASGLLLGARRDIHLDGGTQMVVAVAFTPGQGAGGSGQSMQR
jgi:hypothetical protein